MFPHRLDDVDLAHRGPDHRAAEPGGEVLGRPRGREVEDHRPDRLGSAGATRPGRGSVPRRCSGRPRRRSPAGRRPGPGRTRPPRRGPGPSPRTGRGWPRSARACGRTGRRALPPEDGRLRHPRARSRASPSPPARAVAGVEGDDETSRRRIAATSTVARTSSRWRAVGIVDRPDPAQARPRLAQPRARASRRSSMARPSTGPEDHPARLEELETIVLGRIVRGRDLDPARRLEVADQPAQGGRGDRTGEQGVAARWRSRPPGPPGGTRGPRPGRHARPRSARAPARTA